MAACFSASIIFDIEPASNFQISCLASLPAVVLHQQPVGGAGGITRVIHPLGVGLPWLRDRIADVVHLEKAQIDGSLLSPQVLRQLALRFAHLVGIHHRPRFDGCQRPVDQYSATLATRQFRFRTARSTTRSETAVWSSFIRAEMRSFAIKRDAFVRAPAGAYPALT